MAFIFKAMIILKKQVFFIYMRKKRFSAVGKHYSFALTNKNKF